jgi:hypothetical protein
MKPKSTIDAARNGWSDDVVTRATLTAEASSALLGVW